MGATAAAGTSPGGLLASGAGPTPIVSSHNTSTYKHSRAPAPIRLREVEPATTQITSANDRACKQLVQQQPGGGAVAVATPFRRQPEQHQQQQQGNNVTLSGEAVCLWLYCGKSWVLAVQPGCCRHACKPGGPPMHTGEAGYRQYHGMQQQAH